MIRTLMKWQTLLMVSGQAMLLLSLWFFFQHQKSPTAEGRMFLLMLAVSGGCVYLLGRLLQIRARVREKRRAAKVVPHQSPTAE